MNSITVQAWTTPARTSLPEAGIHLPFVAPLLAGVRGRFHGRVIDYILPNPSGGRGTYIATWSMVTELAAPTMHDGILAQRLLALPALTPAAVRATARAIAAEGFAGRAAADAATRAQASLDAETLRLWAAMLLALIRQSDIPAPEQPRALAALGNAGPGVVTDGFVTLARRLRWDPAALSEALQQLATVYVPMVMPGRYRRLLGLLDRLLDGLEAEQALQGRESTHGPAPALAAASAASPGAAGRAEGCSHPSPAC